MTDRDHYRLLKRVWLINGFVLLLLAAVGVPLTALEGPFARAAEIVGR